MKRIKRAADHLAARRYITLEDGKALIAAARIEPLPLPPSDDEGNDLVREREPISTPR